MASWGYTKCPLRKTAYKHISRKGTVFTEHEAGTRPQIQGSQVSLLVPVNSEAFVLPQRDHYYDDKGLGLGRAANLSHQEQTSSTHCHGPGLESFVYRVEHRHRDSSNIATDGR